MKTWACASMGARAEKALRPGVAGCSSETDGKNGPVALAKRQTAKPMRIVMMNRSVRKRTRRLVKGAVVSTEDGLLSKEQPRN